MTENRFSSYTFGEGRTGIGQLVKFACRPEDVEKVKEFLESTVRDIDIPTTGRVQVPHGGYGRYTRFDVVQHKYAGGGGGFIEALKIKNPPDNRCGFVIHEYSGYSGSVFWEFKDIKKAVAAWGKHWGGGRNKQMSGEKGFIRRVDCGGLEPWFYAVADQHLLGDFAFPEVITEDPEFRMLRKYVVRDSEGLPAIKTCLGMMISEHKSSHYDKEPSQYKVVYWDDGTVWDEYRSFGERPQPLMEKELWIQEAMDKFRKLLGGKITQFTIDFLNGDRFVGKWLPFKSRRKQHHAEGRYKVRITLESGKTMEGEFDFKPTQEVPTLEASLYRQAEIAKEGIASIDAVVRTFRYQDGLRWRGVYSPPERQSD